ncbi:putative sugar phosphate/phosphate translocator [Cucumispora dikerogammari]|nr:putative sugar phosphate/phosphate translocator [Cucumispora dikerogammari]
MKVFFYTFLYFSSSLLLGFFSSHFFGVTKYNFPYPIFVSSCQYLSQYIICSSLLLFIKYMKIYHYYPEPVHHYDSKTKEKNILYNDTEPVYRYDSKTKEKNELYNDILCGLISSLDISLSVYSLRKSSLAFYTMIKSSSPIFILLNSFLLNVERPSIKKFIIIFLISSGVFLTTINNSSAKASSNNGFYTLLLASFIGGFRWAYVQYILQKKISKPGDLDFITNLHLLDEIEPETISIQNKNLSINKLQPEAISIQNKNPLINKLQPEAIPLLKPYPIDDIQSIQNNCPFDDIQSIQNNYEISYFEKTLENNLHVLKIIKNLALPIFIFLLIISIIFEKPQLKVFEACNMKVIIYSCVLSIILIYSEFSLVNISNVMYLSVAGICKEIVIIVYSVFFQNLRFSKLNGFGVFVSSIGILVFSLKI